MKINSNFDPSLEPVINSYPPLANWFERNQKSMAYFQFVNGSNYEHLNYFHGLPSVLILGKMAQAGFVELEKTNLSKEERVLNATISMKKVYEENEPYLPDDAKEQLLINEKTIENGKQKIRKKSFPLK